MKTYTIRNIVINEEEMKLISEAYNAAEEYEYPLFKLDKKGSIRKYTSLSEFEIVMTNERHSLDMGTTDEIELATEDHRDNSLTDVVYDRERDLYHGQPVLYWDNSETHSKTMRFYNAKLKCAFSASGMNNEQFQYGNYQAVELSAYNAWHIESYATLKLGE